MPYRPVFIAVAFALLSACGDGGADKAGESRTYDLKDFTAVEAAAGVSVVVRQGEFAVSATSTNGDLSDLKLEVEGGTLKAYPDSAIRIGRSPDYRVEVSAPDYTSLAAVAGASLTGAGLQLDDLSVTGAAGSEIELTGTCTSLDAEAAAGTTLRLSSLLCATADLTAAAGAVINAHATQSVDATAAAGAAINVSGSPAQVQKDEALGSTVTVE